MATLLDDFCTLEDQQERYPNATIPSRIGAYIIDAIVLYGIGVLLLFLVRDDYPVLYAVLYASAGVLYGVYFESGETQATLGKRALGIKVIKMDNSRITVGEALTRNLLKMVLCWMPLIMLIILYVDEENRGLHDKSANCRVVSL